MKMNEATEGVRELHPHASHNELVQSETEFNRLVDDYKTLQSSLREGVAREGKCLSCKKVGMLGSPLTPIFNSSHDLLLQCLGNDCGKSHSLLAVGVEWLHDVDEPEGGLQGDSKALFEAILEVSEAQVRLKKKGAKIELLRGVLTDLTHNNSNSNNKYIDTGTISGAGTIYRKSANKENSRPGGRTTATGSRNPFKPLPRRSLSATPPTTKRRNRSRSRDRDREPDSPSTPTPEKKVLDTAVETPPVQTMEVEAAAKEKRGRSPAADEQDGRSAEDLETVRKKLRVEEQEERDELQELREENRKLMEMVKMLTLQVEQLTAQIHSINAGNRTDPAPVAVVGEVETVNSIEGDVKEGDGDHERKRKKKKKRVAFPPPEDVAPEAPLSYAEATARTAPDPELAARQERNKRARQRALALFTAAPKPKAAPAPQEWKVMYLKWYPSEKVRKRSTCSDFHHIAMRMLEQLKVRKLVKEVSIMGKHIVSLYYRAEGHEKLQEALTKGKVTILTKLEPVPDILAVKEAATNRVAFLLKRYKHNRNLSALFLEDLDSEDLRQVALKKSGVSRHD